MALKRKFAALLVAAFLSTSLPACGTSTLQEPSPTPATKAADATAKNQVIVAITTEPENGFDPTVGWGHGTTPLIQSTLVQYTQDRNIVTDLATTYTVSADGLVWTFPLRKDAFFTDGTPVSADDVVFTFTTAKNSQSSLDLSYLKTCEAQGDTVVFTLQAPTSTFIHTVATIGIVPAHLYDQNYANAPVGSGPWKFVQWNKGEQVILAANEAYYGKVPEISRATLVFMSEDAAFAAAKAGQVDVALTSATHAAGNQIEGMELAAITTLDNRGFTLPTTPVEGKTASNGAPIGNNVTSRLAIRQALAYGIDRQRIADDAVNGYATPAYSENDGMPWNNPAVKIETDVAKANALLAADGWKDTDGDGILERQGLTATFTCIYPSGDSVRQAVALAAAAQAKELGISIQVEGIGWDEIGKRMFTDAVLMGWGSSNPYTSYSLFHSKNMLREDCYNPEAFSNNTVDGYLDAALHADTVEAANTLWQKAQWDGSTGTAMQGDCPWVWLVNVQHLYYVKNGLDIGTQQLHAHGASWPLVQNLSEWKWTDGK